MWLACAVFFSVRHLLFLRRVLLRHKMYSRLRRVSYRSLVRNTRSFLRRTLFVFILPPFPLRHIIKNAALYKFLVRRQLLQHDLVELGRLIVVEHYNALKLVQP